MLVCCGRDMLRVVTRFRLEYLLHLFVAVGNVMASTTCRKWAAAVSAEQDCLFCGSLAVN